MKAATRTRAAGRLRAAFLVIAVGFAIAALAAQWDDVRDDLGRLSIAALAASILAALASLSCAFLAWRETLAGLGHRLPVPVAARIFFLGQVSKYVPGSVWSIVAQTELAKVVGVRRERTATAGIVVLAVSLAVGLCLSVLAVPAIVSGDADGSGTGYLWALALLVPLAVALHPRVLTALVARGLALFGRPPLEAPLTAGVVGRISAFSVGTNALLGLQIGILGLDIGAESGTTSFLLLAVGAYGLAASVSLVVIPLPAGAGLREVILVLVLAPEIGAAGATLVAVIARLTLTLADIGTAALAAASRPPVGAVAATATAETSGEAGRVRSDGAEAAAETSGEPGWGGSGRGDGRRRT